MEKNQVEISNVGYSEFLTYNPYCLSHQDHHLTELMEHDDDYSKFIVLSDYLKLYGIHIVGKTNMFNTNKTKLGNEVCAIILDKNFPVENHPLFEELYGYEDSVVFIALNRDENREYGFWFNQKDKTYELERLVYGKPTFSKKYNSFEEMFIDYNENVLPKYG